MSDAEEGGRQLLIRQRDMLWREVLALQHKIEGLDMALAIITDEDTDKAHKGN